MTSAKLSVLTDTLAWQRRSLCPSKKVGEFFEWSTQERF